MSSQVTIGVPVYNGAATLRRAVESALAQSYPAAVVHISDNASTDGTEELGRALAAEHERVRYTRHPVGLGPRGNFGFLLDGAGTDYFMWLAHDDYLEPSFLERMVRELQADLTLVACTSRVRFVRASDGTTRFANGTYPLLADDPVRNLAAYLSDPSDNSRVFGLYRTAVLRAAFPAHMYHAYDWAVAAGTLMHGRHMEVPDVLMVRDETPIEAYVTIGHRENASGLTRLFPALAMTVDLLKRQRIPRRWPVIKALLHINLELHLNHALAYHARYGRAIEPLLRKYVLWRLEVPRPPVPQGRDEVPGLAQHAD